MSRLIMWVLVNISLVGCVSVPPQAGQLSAQLGQQIQSLKNAHLLLTHRFFQLKRQQVDDFIEQTWLPLFAQEVFANPPVSAAFATIVEENNAQDRLRFLTTLGPALQARINRKRQQLITPLDQLEDTLTLRISNDYQSALTINNTLTAYLNSAAQLSLRRDAYLDAIGVSPQNLGAIIDQVDNVITDLTTKADRVEQLTDQGKIYLDKIKQLKQQLLSL